VSGHSGGRAGAPSELRRAGGAYGPFELVPLEAVPVIDEPARAGSAPSVEAVRQEGFDEGFAAGVAHAQAQLEGAASAMAAAASQLQAMRGDAAASVEPAAVELALRIAEQAMGAWLVVDRGAIVEVVRGALRRLVERDRVLILVNPDDLENVRDHAARLVGELGGIEHCEVQAERRVRPGGAIVRTAEGEVDATLDTKLARAREVLEHELANG
jgi:flagellar assembly protein FliH